MNIHWRAVEVILFFVILAIIISGIMYLAYIGCGDGCVAGVFVIMMLMFMVIGCISAICIKMCIIKPCEDDDTESGSEESD